MSHPAGIKDDRLWFGIECEGALSGHATAFIRQALTSDELALVWARESASIFLCENFFDWDWAQAVLLPQAESRCVPVVCGRYPHDLDNFLAQSCAGRISLMVRVSASWFDKLRQTDEVSLGVPYSMITFKVQDGVRTTPEMYLGDKL